MNYAYHPAAEYEQLQAIAYYESLQPGLGSVYLAAFEAAMERALKAPISFPIEHPPDVRRVRLRRFPYSILYREDDGLVHILAVAHSRLAVQNFGLAVCKSLTGRRTPCSASYGASKSGVDMRKEFTAVVEKDAETGLFVGYVPGFPGAHSQGSSLDELNNNLREVIEMLLEDGEPDLECEFVGTQRVFVA